MDCYNSIFMHGIPQYEYRHTRGSSTQHKAVVNMVFLHTIGNKKRCEPHDPHL